MKYFIIAVNHTEDIQAARLSKEIKRNDVRAEIIGIAGPHMVKEEVAMFDAPFKPSSIGNSEFSPDFLVSKVESQMKDYFKSASLDIVIVLNSACIGILKYAKNLGIRTCYYCNPYSQTNKRLNTKCIDKVLLTVPLESYKKDSIDVEYVGCPIVDFIKDYRYDPQFQIDPNQITIAILPGEEIKDIDLSIELIQSVSEVAPDYHFLIAGSSQIRPEVYQNFKNIKAAEIFFNKDYDLVKRSNAAIVFPRAVSLETAILNCPQVFIVKQNIMSRFLSKIMNKMKWQSLVNVISQKEVIKEIVYNKSDINPILNELRAIITDHHYCARMMINYQEILDKIGADSASRNAAGLIDDWINPV